MLLPLIVVFRSAPTPLRCEVHFFRMRHVTGKPYFYRQLLPSSNIHQLTMNNNDIFKKLRVALQLRDDQIVEILERVDFRISKGEVGNFFRQADHEKFVECGDQVLRNFLNGLIIHLRGTKENPKNAAESLEKIKADRLPFAKTSPPKAEEQKKAATQEYSKNFKSKPRTKPVSPVENVRYKNGKKRPGTP